MEERKQVKEPITYPVEEYLETSVSCLLFTRDWVIKTWKHEHPLIGGLGDANVRQTYLRGERAKGDGINQTTDVNDSIYLGVVAVEILTGSEGGGFLVREIPAGELLPGVSAGDSQNWDFALKMKRFPECRTMESMLTNTDGENRLTDKHVKDAIHEIITYHRSLPKLADDPEYGETQAEQVAEQMPKIIEEAFSFGLLLDEKFSTILAHDKVEQLAEEVRQNISSHAAEFTQAVVDGEIKNGHGDLKMTNAYVGDGQVGEKDKVYFLDAIAFMPEWCLNDLLSDLAYFVLYFDYLDADHFDHWLEVVSQKYQELKPGKKGLRQDTFFWFYMSYRAAVQAKVAAIEANAGAENKGKEAKRFLTLAQKYLDFAYKLG